MSGQYPQINGMTDRTLQTRVNAAIQRPVVDWAKAVGDFYTAEQLQPVFGRLIAQYVRARFAEMGEPSDFRFVEIGALICDALAHES